VVRRDSRRYMTRSRKREVLKNRVQRAPQVLTLRFSKRACLIPASEAVIAAYNGRCALSGLPAPVLLDAAHIVADNDERLGQPVVPNATQPVAFVLIPHDYATRGKNVG
jgi:hypothetical protein